MNHAVHRATGTLLKEDVFTIGFARRATTYKRAGLVFSDLDRLQAIAQQNGAVQLILGGKAHPKDEGGKAVIQRIHEASRSVKGSSVSIAYIEDTMTSHGAAFSLPVSTFGSIRRKGRKRHPGPVV